MGVLIKKLLFIVICLLLIDISSDISSAATIHGSIYNVVLDTESDVRIEINTMPKQFMISKDGAYSFNVPNGNYTIKAYTQDEYAEEEILVLDDGEYLIDIVLAPIIGHSIDYYMPDGYIDTYNVSLQDPATSKINYLPLIIGLTLIICISIILFLMFVRKQSSGKKDKEVNEEDNIKNNVNASSSRVADSPVIDKNKQKALEFIKHNERTTQKDLRKQLPLSEAKISLIVAELEHEGRIKKIRKGRGNILVYIK